MSAYNVYNKQPQVQPQSQPQGGAQLGLNTPISMAEPSELDLYLTKKLEEQMHVYDLYDGPEEAKVRVEVLGRLNMIISEWIVETAVLCNIPNAQDIKGRVSTYGSFRLGVHGKGADIDTLCLVPRHVLLKEHFFGLLVAKLRANPDIKELVPVEDTYVPVITFIYTVPVANQTGFTHGNKIDNLPNLPNLPIGIPIDLVMAKLPMHTIPGNLDITDNSILRNLDEKSVVSLNGCRVTDRILQLVPNVGSFRVALRCIKHWAKLRGLYGNSMGFPGGVAWAMLVAFTCQLYPNAAPATLVSKFFILYNQWNWPKPIQLCSIEDIMMGFKIWSPNTSYADARHLMPIITPVYPCMNATRNVSISTRKIMTDEFKRGVEVTNEIYVRMSSLKNKTAQELLERETTATLGNPLKKTVWARLFDTTDFFTRHNHFLQIDAITNNEQDKLTWEGLVEGRGLRYLVQYLEKKANMTTLNNTNTSTTTNTYQMNSAAPPLEAACPFTKGFTSKLEIPTATDLPEDISQADDANTIQNKGIATKFCTSYFIGLKFTPRTISPPAAASDGSSSIEASLPPTGPAIDLTTVIAQFDQSLDTARQGWNKTVEDMNCIVRYVKRNQLPEYILKEYPRAQRKKRKLPNPSAPVQIINASTPPIIAVPDDANDSIKKNKGDTSGNVAALHDDELLIKTIDQTTHNIVDFHAHGILDQAATFTPPNIPDPPHSTMKDLLSSEISLDSEPHKNLQTIKEAIGENKKKLVFRISNH